MKNQFSFTNYIYVIKSLVNSYKSNETTGKNVEWQIWKVISINIGPKAFIYNCATREVVNMKIAWRR